MRSPARPKAAARSLPALALIPPLHRATHRIGLHIGSTLGVTQAEAHVLQHLASAGECTIGELHRAFAHRRSTLTSVLDRLVERGVITRESSPADRRTFVIGLTPEGRPLAQRVHVELARLEAAAVGAAGLSARDLKGFDAVLAALDAAIGGADGAA